MLNTLASLPVLGAVLGVVLWWLRRGKRKAEERAAREEKRADVAVATATADRAVEARKDEARVEAQAAIPEPTSTEPSVIVEDALAQFKAAEPRRPDAETQARAAARVRKVIAAPRKRGGR